MILEGIVTTISPAGDINIVQRSGNVNAVFVTTFNNANALADKHFQMIAVC